MSHQSPHGIRVSLGFKLTYLFQVLAFLYNHKVYGIRKMFYNIVQHGRIYGHGNVFGLTWYLIYANVFGLESNELAKLQDIVIN